MRTDHTILTIQKLVFLLDDFHFAEFESHLSEIKARLPLKLIQRIKLKLPEFDSHEELCKKVYGSYALGHRQSFNQLASYTFKLSGYLSLNYPSYLTHNYSKTQILVNEGRMQQANFLAKTLEEIAERTEDYQSQIFSIKYFLQQSYLYKDITQGTKLTDRLTEVYKAERFYTEIIAELRKTLNISITGIQSQKQLEEHKKRFQELYTSQHAAVRMLSRYAYVYIIYYFEPEKLTDKATLDTIHALERDLDNFCYVVFPFMFDLKSNVAFLKLNSIAVDFATKEGKRELKELEEHHRHIKFWQNYLNMPQIFGITAKASYYLSKCHHHLHRSDYDKVIPSEDLADIKQLAATCEKIFEAGAQQKFYKNDLINLQMLYGSLLILSGGKDIAKGAAELESLLISYQQVNLTGMLDSVFVCLMVSYFAQKKYTRCSETFKRYLKVIKNKPVYEDNDINIHTYYYLSQWLDTGRNQYLIKLKANYERARGKKHFAEQRHSIETFVEYFKIPVKL